MDRQTDRQIGGQMYGVGGKKNGWIGRFDIIYWLVSMDGYRQTQIDGLMDELMCRELDRQTDRHRIGSEGISHGLSGRNVEFTIQLNQ